MGPDREFEIEAERARERDDFLAELEYDRAEERGLDAQRGLSHD